MPFLMLEGPDGRPVPAQGTADGKLVVDGGGGGGGDASAANQLDQLAAEQATQAAVESIDVSTAPLGAKLDDIKTTIDQTNSIVATDGSVLTVNTAVIAVETAVNNLATAQTDGTQRVRLTDGTNNAAVTNAEPSTAAYGVVVRQAPTFAPGKHIHAQTSVGVTNAANKLLFGFTNNTGQTLYVLRVHLSNTQTSAITGVFCQMNVQVSASAITGGTTITNVSSPALVAACRDIRNAVPAGLTWNSNGTIASPSTIESARWTTDEVQPNGGGSVPELIFAAGFNGDVFDFSDDPVVIPNGYSCAVVCDAAATNGQTLVDFNIAQEA